jgi:hypothetical protein
MYTTTLRGRNDPAGIGGLYIVRVERNISDCDARRLCGSWRMKWSSQQDATHFTLGRRE